MNTDQVRGRTREAEGRAKQIKRWKTWGKPFLASAAWLSIILFVGCSLPDDTTFIKLKAVSLDRTSSVLFTGEAVQLTAVFDPSDAARKDVAWATSNPGVAVVSSLGHVTGVSAGTATITVTAADGGKTATCAVAVMSDIEFLSAAARLAGTQNSDGGWEWLNPDSSPSTGVPSAYNTLGITAQGLLAAYKWAGNGAYLVASELTYQALLANSESLTPTVRKIRGPDISFLVELSEVTGDSTYANFAKTRYQATVTEFGGGTAAGLAQSVRTSRLAQPSLIAWDINLIVRGVIALDSYFPGQGFGADADAMTEVVYTAMYQSPVDFQIADQEQDSYWLAISAAFESFTLTGLHAIERDSLRSSLLASQQPDGHFGGTATTGLVQTTAYAVVALVRAGDKEAAMDGVLYLTGEQGANGGWQESDGSEYSEVDSEALYSMHAFMERF